MFQRADAGFAITAAALIGLGLAAQKLFPTQGLTVMQAGQSHFLSIRTSLFALAALFCLFAFLYSLWFLPVSRGAGWWHLALSLISVVLFAGGWAALIARETRFGFPSSLGPLGTSLAIGILLSVPLFLGTQAWFAVVFIRAWLRR